MGAFFTNLQVFVGRTGKEKAMAKVLEAIGKLAKADGLVTQETGGDADRTLLVGVSGDWLSVYDEETESQDLNVLDAVATALSATSKCPVVGVLVHDSDVLELRLFDGGKFVDRFNNAPSYFGKASSEEKSSARGQPKLWKKALGKSVDADALASLWHARRRPTVRAAEELLQETASLLGWDDESVSVGYNYIRERGDALTELRFRRREIAKPTVLRGGPAFTQATSGAFRILEGGRGEFDCSVRNIGPAGTGLLIRAAGPAFDAEILTAESVTLNPRAPLEARFELETSGSNVSYVASFERASIPAGISNQDLAALTRKPAKYVEAFTQSSLFALCSFRVLRAGQASFEVTFIPLESAHGACSHAVSSMVR